MWNLTKSLVKRNFKVAAKEVKKEQFMCTILRFLNGSLLLCLVNFKKSAIPIYEKYGFTRNNFHNFVKKYYPELMIDMWYVSNCWCDVTDETLNAKKHFLEYLSVNIDNPFIEN